MAFLGQNFDANTVNPDSQFDPLPSGEYTAIIIDSALKPTSKGTGQYLELTYQVIEGPMQGRQVWARLNLANPNPKTVQIAQQQLSAICHACGVMQVHDSQQLHNIVHVIRVDFVAADGVKRTRAGNEVRAWKRIEGARAPGQAAAAPFARPQTAPAAPVGAPAWAKPAA